jgi:hypothetical protein
MLVGGSVFESRSRDQVVPVRAALQPAHPMPLFRFRYRDHCSMTLTIEE